MSDPIIWQGHFKAGYFYVVQPIPAYPYHLKVGITNNPENRLKHYQVLCPQARMLKSWHLFDIARVEGDAINYLMCKDYHRIGGEVFFARDPAQLVGDLDGFFNSTRVEYHSWDRRGAVMTIEETARYMERSMAEVYNLVKAGKLTSSRLSTEDKHLLSMESICLYLSNEVYETDRSISSS